MLVDRWPEDFESKPQVFYTGNLWGAPQPRQVPVLAYLGTFQVKFSISPSPTLNVHHDRDPSTGAFSLPSSRTRSCKHRGWASDGRTK